MMNNDVVISVKNVTKTFSVRQSGSRTFKAAVLERFLGRARYHRQMKALDNVSFEAKKGETLGIIGSNGAGKSTLLALITGTMSPASGSITTSGTVSSLLELGAGFHPELTGRENVFLYGAIMGISRAQMEARFDAIVEFAELSDFIDQPVKHYSSGMYVRLGFAVAVEVDPDILLIDEVLAVGDEAFQRKCISKMEQFRRDGKTMLIISHDIPTIQKISDRILFLDRGKVAGLGDPGDIAEDYRSASRSNLARAMEREWGTGQVVIENVTMQTGPDEHETDAFHFGGSMSLKIDYSAAEKIQQPVFGFAIRDVRGATLFGSNTQIEGLNLPSVEGKGSLKLHIRDIRLANGTYLLSVSVHSADHRINYHRLDNKYPFTVKGDKSFEGVYMTNEWSRLK